MFPGPTGENREAPSLDGRAFAPEDEVLETFANEIVRHEVAYLLETSDGPVLVYAIEAEDLDHAARAVEENPLPIDFEHRRVMQEVLEEPIELDPILDLKA